MKAMLAIALTLTSLVANATATCSFRFNRNLAIAVTIDGNVSPKAGTISWDDANTCGRENGQYICTEMWPGAFQVKFRSLANASKPTLKISSIRTSDDLGNRYRADSRLGRFVKAASFTIVDREAPEVRMNLHGFAYDMDCRRAEGSQL